MALERVASKRRRPVFELCHGHFSFAVVLWSPMWHDKSRAWCHEGKQAWRGVTYSRSDWKHGRTHLLSYLGTVVWGSPSCINATTMQHIVHEESPQRPKVVFPVVRLLPSCRCLQKPHLLRTRTQLQIVDLCSTEPHRHAAVVLDIPPTHSRNRWF